MKNSNFVKLVLILSTSGLLAAGCGQRDSGPGPGIPPPAAGEVYVDSAPPPLIVETVPPMPGDGVIWIGGNWFWEGGAWRWHAGYWGHPPTPGAHWVPNHYEYRGGRHVYARGGWR
jgi:YXWGXW repeat-containing protein